MAFGLIQWLMSFAVFFFVLGIITWTALHLSQKEHEFVSARFLDGYPTRREEYVRFPLKIVLSRVRLLHSIVLDRFSKPPNSANDLTPIANNQGFEVRDSAQFYNILRAISSAQEHTVNNTRDNAADSDITTAILASSALGNNSTWNEGITAAVSISDESVTLNNHRNVSEDVTKS